MSLTKIKKDLEKLKPTSKDIEDFSKLVVSIPAPIIWLGGEAVLAGLQSKSMIVTNAEGEDVEANPMKKPIDILPIPIPNDPFNRTWDLGKIEQGSILRAGWFVMNAIYAFGPKRNIQK